MDLIVDGNSIGSANSPREAEKWGAMFTLSDLSLTRKVLEYVAYVDDDPKSISKSHAVYEYRASAAVVRDRLDLLGFNLEGFALDYAFQRRYEVYLHRTLYKDRYPLASMKLGKVLDVATRLMSYWDPSTSFPRQTLSGPERYLTRNIDLLNSFPVTDIRFLIRALLERVPGHADVVFQFGREWRRRDVRGVCMQPHPFAPRAAPDSKIIVLTEGPSDNKILQKSMSLLFPHLADYFTWPDLNRRPGAGATGVVETVKGLLCGEVNSRIIAVCDNDIEGVRAVAAIKKLRPPPNIVAFTYPHINSASAWPCCGPNDQLELEDLNGRGCSLELFFGTRVLGTGQSRKPVHWAMNGKERQGSIEDKESLRQEFLADVLASTPGRLVGDWTDMRILLQSLLFNFTNPPDDIKIREFSPK